MSQSDVNVTALQEHIDTLQSLLGDVKENADGFFLLTMGLVVFLMQCGFGFLEAGSVQSKNTTNILIKNMFDSCIAAVCYWAFGWAFAYGPPGNAFIGGLGSSGQTGQFFLSQMPLNQYPMWFFQYVFCATAATIVSGALAERCEMIAYFVYCVVITGFVYPVVSHWAWDESGWLNRGIGGYQYKDFAGSGVVHCVGGVGALVGAIILGPRVGRFDTKRRKAIILKGHSVPFAALGGFILMFGFFAFNGGSQASIHKKDDAGVVALAMTNTILSGVWAAITAVTLQKLFSKKWSLIVCINSILAGMVSACAGCDALDTWAASVLGVGSGFVYYFSSWLIPKLKIDDPLEASAVHLGGGFWGLVASPILIRDGIIYKWSGAAFAVWGVNILGFIVISLWTAVLMSACFICLKVFNVFRVPEEVEIKGLDIYKHGEPAYPIEAYGHGWEMHRKPLELFNLRRRQLSLIEEAEPVPDSSAEKKPKPKLVTKQSCFENPEAHALDVMDREANGKKENT